ncbi:hypothetical protein J6590_047703 [Homalodisca vitripennis]|nr:hypothetical protein J6590_047703 [Homalodisca vitripennis]
MHFNAPSGYATVDKRQLLIEDCRGTPHHVSRDWSHSDCMQDFKPISFLRALKKLIQDIERISQVIIFTNAQRMKVIKVRTQPTDEIVIRIVAAPNRSPLIINRLLQVPWRCEALGWRCAL